MAAAAEASSNEQVIHWAALSRFSCRALSSLLDTNDEGTRENGAEKRRENDENIQHCAFLSPSSY